jgi:hypothetical protein
MASASLPECIISGDLASQRVHYFTTQKKSALDDCIGYKPEAGSLTYPVPVFLQLLTSLTAEPGKFTGLRVYFAAYLKSDADPGSKYIPAGLEDTFTLIFVFTKEAVVKGKTINQDDVSNCYTISQGQLIRLPDPGSVPPAANTAANWVKHFQNRIPDLNKHGVAATGNAHFNETKSLWYDIKLFMDSPERQGLVRYINSELGGPNPIVAVDAHLACFTEGDEFPRHQLTLIFNLRRKASTPAKAASGVSSPGAAHTAAMGTAAMAPMMAMDDSSDMGLPCPPDTSCNINGGGLFP